jgi:hypothetical protein
VLVGQQAGRQTNFRLGLGEIEERDRDRKTLTQRDRADNKNPKQTAP